LTATRKPLGDRAKVLVSVISHRRLKEPLNIKGGVKLGFRFDSYHGNNHTIGRLRLSVTNEKDPGALWPVPTEVADLLAVHAAKRTLEQQRLLAAHYRTVSPTIRQIEREIFRVNERENELANHKIHRARDEGAR